MNRTALVVALAFVSAAAAPAETIVLRGATVHPVSGAPIPNASIVLKDGKIAAVGAAVATPAGARVVDVTGKHVYPSLFPPATVLGLVEISAVRSTVDISELGEINPQARADFAMNFDSELLPVARSAGILIAGVTPLGGLVSGSAAAMKLEGWTREDATLKAPAAITVAWPELTLDRSPTARRSVRAQEKERDDALRKLRDVFDEARAYARAKGAETQKGIPRHDTDARLEALVPAVEGKIPVIILAGSVAQIRGALGFAKEQGLRIAILGGADAWRLPSELAQAKVPVILDAVLDLPARADDPYDARYAAAAILAKAGVRVAFNDGSSASGAATVRNLPHQAAAAVAFGFSPDKALEAMTLEPARILGVADRVGSLEPGKDATLIVTDGDILDLRSHVVAAYLDGRPLDLSDKQKRLYERYKNPAQGEHPMNWLFKEEPTHYAYADLVRDGKTSWSGVKNPLAQKHLRSVKKGDRIFYYHTGDEKAVVGIAKAAGDAYADPKDKAGKLATVDVVPLRSLPRPVALAEIKAKAFFKDFPLVRISRLSVMPVSDREWDEIEKMAGR